MVQVEKSLANVMLYLAVMRSGAVYQPLNPAYTLAEADYFIEDSEPVAIVCDPGRQAEMRAIADRHKVQAVVNLDRHGEGSLAVPVPTLPQSTLAMSAALRALLVGLMLILAGGFVAIVAPQLLHVLRR